MVGKAHPTDTVEKYQLRISQRLLKMSKVFTFVGHSGSGKTTLVEKLLRELSGRGLRGNDGADELFAFMGAVSPMFHPAA